MITNAELEKNHNTIPLSKAVDFLDNLRKPVKQSDRQEGDYPYYGANGQQGTINNFIFDEPLILLAEDGGFFDQPDRGIAYYVEGKTWVNNHAHVLRPKQNFNLRYLLRVLENYDVRPYISGTTRSKLTKTQAEKIKVPLIPLPEQKRIAAILDQADSLRRLRRQAIEKLNTLSQSIFYEMFGDIKTNPLGWNKAKLGDLCGVGSSKRVFVSEFIEKGIPFYRGTEVGKLAEKQDINPDLFISEEHYNKLINHSGKPKIGDLLLPSICHDGRIWQVDDEKPFYFKDGRVLWIKNDPKNINSEYLRLYLKSLFLTSYLSVASGTTFSELKIINLKNLSILFPPIELQNEYERKVKAIEALINTHKQSLEHLETLFLSLQQKAFKGEL